MSNIKRGQHQNCSRTKMNNIRVSVWRPEDDKDGFTIEFKKLLSDPSEFEEIKSTLNRGRISVLGFILSVDAAKELVMCLHNEITRHHDELTKRPDVSGEEKSTLQFKVMK